MKRITASEARRSWFRILDEVARGAVVYIERHGKRIVLRQEDAPAGDGERPDYTRIIEAPDAARADAWGWEWDESGELVPRDLGEE